MTTGTTTITGLSDLDKLLKTLPGQIQRNVMRTALRRGQNVLAEAAKSNLRSQGAVDTGELERSIRVTFRRKSEQYGWMRSYLIAGNKKAYYAHMIEFGTGSHYEGNGRTVGGPYKITPKVGDSLFLGGVLRNSVTHPGIRPKSFMRRAIDTHTEASVDAVANYLSQRIPREIKKVA